MQNDREEPLEYSCRKRRLSRIFSWRSSRSVSESRQPAKNGRKFYRKSIRKLFSKLLSTSKVTKVGNVVNFLSNECPRDVLSKILAFADPKAISTLHRTNRYLYEAIEDDSTWQALCEELYKWDPVSELSPPSSWKLFYRRNPCVPVDYPTVESALEAISDIKTRRNRRGKLIEPVVSQPKVDVTIWLRPGVYEQSQALHIHARQFGTTVTIQGMVVPSVSDLNSRKVILVQANSSKSNEPLLKVTKGQVVVRDMTLVHHTMGLDIWNGNAAVHVECDEHDTSSLWGASFGLCSTSVSLERVEMTSSSGRGLVALRGSHVSLVDSLVHHCAATGIYQSGSTSRLEIRSSDVMYNGVGNRKTKGIGRGHSGVYIEESRVLIHDCNVSNNTSSGVTLVGESSLAMTGSDLVSNGTNALEVSQEDRLPSLDRSNHLSILGAVNPRSSVLKQARLHDVGEDEDELVASLI